MSKYAFETNNVKKYYNGGKVKALDGVSLKAEYGKVLALLGPNGAGKTTIVRMLSTLLAPTSGTVKVMGMDVIDEAHDVREIIGLAGQYAAVDEFLTGRENIQMSGRLYHIPKAEVKKRTDDILARLKPTTGLDPRTRQELWHIIQGLVDDGTTVLLTTQYMDEADELADHIAVIDQGKLIAEGTSDELKTHLGGDVVEFTLDKESDVEAAIKAVTKLSSQKPKVDEDGLTITVPVKNGSKGLLSVVEELNKIKISPASLSLHRPSLDDVFLALTGKKAVSAIKPEAKKKGRKY